MNIHVKKQTDEYFQEVLPQFNHIDGDYVEVGFGKGDTVTLIAKGMRQGIYTEREMWLFDSFEGLPEPTEEDNGRRKPQKGQLSFRGFRGFRDVDYAFLFLPHWLYLGSY